MANIPPERELVPISSIPNDLTAEANQYIRQYCVSMVVADDNDALSRPCAGVLCVIGNAAGILTARHVWDKLISAKRLVLMLGPKHPYRIDRTLLDAYIPRNALVPELSGASVPDIAFIPLPDSIKVSIEARYKVFYSIDRRSDNSAFDLYSDAGFWIAVGSPIEMMDVEVGEITSLSYITDIEKAFHHDGWDYLFVNLNLECNPPIPSDLHGMSGGGLWRVKFTPTGTAKEFAISNPSQDIVLQGIIFLQTALDGRQLIAHGPTSIYKCMPKEISELKKSDKK